VVLTMTGGFLLKESDSAHHAQVLNLTWLGAVQVVFLQEQKMDRIAKKCKVAQKAFIRVDKAAVAAMHQAQIQADASRACATRAESLFQHIRFGDRRLSLQVEPLHAVQRRMQAVI
jgi:hypothetical protein